MLSTVEKKEKTQLFQDLDRLDSLSDEEVDIDRSSSPGTPSKRPSRQSNLKLKRSISAGTVADMEEIKRKRKASQEISNPDRTAAPKPSLTRAATLPGKLVTGKKPPKLKRNITDLSNLEARKKGTGRPKLKSLPTWAKIAAVPAEQQIFKGLVFCRFHDFLALLSYPNSACSLCAKQRRRFWSSHTHPPGHPLWCTMGA